MARVARQGHGLRRRQESEGRKRHLLVDTQGWLLATRVSGASETDRNGAGALLGQADALQLSRLEVICADGGYRGKLQQEAEEECGFEITIVKKEEKGGFKVLPKRWIVERTFAWIDKCRRLSKDYERLVPTSQAFILLAMCRLMLNYIKN